MRSDERLFFWLASGAMAISIVYTIFFHVIPLIEERHNYVYGHCTVTGAPQWEKYETLEGIKERVVVPVELRIGTYQNALTWNAWNSTGGGLLKSSDVYHQGLARDSPSGWQYFSVQDKDDYLGQYALGREFECWARPSTGFHDITFNTGQKNMHRIIPQIIFVVIVVGLCLASGVCVGMMDQMRRVIGLPPPQEYGPDGPVFGTSAPENVKRNQPTYGSAYGSVDAPHMRQFASEVYTDERGKHWV